MRACSERAGGQWLGWRADGLAGEVVWCGGTAAPWAISPASARSASASTAAASGTSASTARSAFADGPRPDLACGPAAAAAFLRLR